MRATGRLALASRVALARGGAAGARTTVVDLVRAVAPARGLVTSWTTPTSSRLAAPVLGLLRRSGARGLVLRVLGRRAQGLRTSARTGESGTGPAASGGGRAAESGAPTDGVGAVPRPRARVQGKRTLASYVPGRKMGILAAGGILALLGGTGLVFYSGIEHGYSLSDISGALSSKLSAFDDHADPTREMFSPKELNTQFLPVDYQDGTNGEPIITLVFEMEHLLINKEYDRKSGLRYLKRPFLDPMIRSLAAVGEGRVHGWFWSEEPTAKGTLVLDSIFLRPDGTGPGMAVISQLGVVLLGKEHTFREPKVGDVRPPTVGAEGEAGEGSKPGLAALLESMSEPASDFSYIKRVQMLPRYAPSVVLVDTQVANYRANPNNTLLLPPFKAFHEKDDTLMTVIAFVQLFKSMFKNKQARTPSDVLQWLRSRYPEIETNPYRMGEFIRLETVELRKQQMLLETKSIGAQIRKVQKETLIGQGKAVTPTSTRYTRVEKGSLLEQRISSMKSMQEQMKKQQLEAMKAEEEA